MHHLLWHGGIEGADVAAIVDRDEVDRLQKRFMKLDKVRALRAGSQVAGSLEMQAQARGRARSLTADLVLLHHHLEIAARDENV